MFRKLKNSPFVKKPFGGINGDLLRLLAIISMTIDHTRVAVDGDMWMKYVGRLAFPVFAFQIAEGFIHTSNLKKYFLRILIFAIVSEIPFNVFCSSEVFFPQYQNVLVTFALSIVALKLVQMAKKEPAPLKIAGAGLSVAFIVFLAEVLHVDYGGAGVVIVVAFYLFRDFPFAFLAQFATVFIVFVFFYPGRPVLLGFGDSIFRLPVQAFALFSFVPIWLYNGKKGKKSKILQYGFYSFYPAHIALLCVIRYVLKNVI